MNRKNYKRLFALCSALLASQAACSANPHTAQRAAFGMYPKQIEGKLETKKQSEGISNVWIFGVPVLISAVTLGGAKAYQYGLLGGGEQGLPDEETPDFETPLEYEIPQQKTGVGTEVEPTDLEQSYGAKWNDYIRHPWTLAQSKAFDDSIGLQRYGKHGWVDFPAPYFDFGIPHGDDGKQYFSSLIASWSAPIPSELDYAKRVTLLLPLLGKKYNPNSNSATIRKNSELIESYVQSIIENDYSCITIFTVPRGEDKDKIWLIVDGMTKNTFERKSGEGYTFDLGQPKIALKVDHKNMWHGYTDMIYWCDGEGETEDGRTVSLAWVKDSYRFSKNGVDKRECRVIG